MPSFPHAKFLPLLTDLRSRRSQLGHCSSLDRRHFLGPELTLWEIERMGGGGGERVVSGGAGGKAAGS